MGTNILEKPSDFTFSLQILQGGWNQNIPPNPTGMSHKFFLLFFFKVIGRNDIFGGRYFLHTLWDLFWHCCLCPQGRLYRWSHQVPSNCRDLSNKFHGVISVTSHKTIISIFTTVRTSNLKLSNCLKTIFLCKLKYCHKLSTTTWRF